MLEAVLAWFINNWVGEYFDNVNTDQLSIAYGDGHIELDGLPLRVEPFRRLGLPFDVRSGYAGKLRLALRLRSGACSVFIDELFLVCGPRSEFSFDERREHERAEEVKVRLLEALENKWKFCFDTHQDMSYYPSYSSFLSFSTSLFANFTENLQFHVHDVHLRYEDDVTQSDANIVTGLIIKDLSIQSADDSWQPTFVVAGSSHVTRKLVELQGFSVYLDSNVPLVKQLQRQDMIDEMRNGMQSDAPHVYILDPVNGKAYVSRNLSDQPLKSRSTPRIKIDFQFEQIALSLNIVQYQLFLSMSDEISRRQLLLKNCRFRPKESVKQNPKAWWTYAMDVFLHPRREQLQRENWNFVLRRCSQITKYCDVYFALIAQPEDVSREMKAIREQVESELSYEEIKCLRELVYERYKKLCLPSRQQPPATSQGWSYLQSWLPFSWFGGESGAAASGADDGTENVSFTSNFEDDLMDVLTTAADECQFTQDAVFTQITFSLDQASAVLVADPLYLKSTPVRKPHAKKMQQIMQFVMKKPFVTIETRPRTCTHKFHAKFSELTLEDKVSSAPNFAYLIAPQANSHFASSNRERNPQSAQDPALFELILEKKWGDNTIVNKLFVKTDPLQIVYSKSVFDVLYRFFSSKSFLSQERSSSLTNATRIHYEQLKSQTKAGIQNAMEDLFVEKMSMGTAYTVKWEFDLNISAPQVIIPRDISAPESALVIFDLGRLVFRNRTLDHLRSLSEDVEVYVTPPSSPPPERIENENFSSTAFDVKSLYQRFCLEINDIQLVVGSASDNWNHALQRGSGPLHVLNRFSLTFELQRRISSFSPDLPRVILTGSLPQLFVFLDECKIRSLKNTFDLVLKSKSSHEQATDPPVAKVAAVPRPNRIFFLTELNVHRFSVALQCRKENLAEFQVFEVQCKLEKSKKFYSVSFSVSSLMMIDAHQKLGKEFEILVASHRDLIIDPRNGYIADAQNRVRSYSTVSHSPPDKQGSDALISIKLTSCNNKETVDVVFNHFDVIANQETLVELVAFFKGIFPEEDRAGGESEFNQMKSRAGFSRQTEIRIDFRQLNVLLLRSIECLKTGQEKKVATASFSGAKICIRLSHDAIVEGSLQRMKIMDLCSKDGPGDQAIMKIGSDQEVLGPGQSTVKAVEFTLKRTFAENLLDVNISLVSLYYFHSPRFLRQLTSCAKEFKAYMSELASTIRTAAAEVAKELVLTPNIKSGHMKERKNRKISATLVKELRVQLKADNPLVVLPTSSSFIEGIKNSIWNNSASDDSKSTKSVFFESFAIGLDVQNGSVRFVDDVDEDRSLIEILFKEVYLFHQSKDSINKGNVRTTVSSDYFNQEKSGWEPLVEVWPFTMAWDVKTDRQGKDGIIHRLIGTSRKGGLQLISNDTINFNVTNMSLDLYRYMKEKWDAVDIESPDSVGIHSMTSSPVSLLVNPQQKAEVIPASEWKFVMEVQCVGVSLVNRLNEELLYITLSCMVLEYLKTDAKHSMNCSIRDMQVDNQLREHCKDVALHPLLVDSTDPMNGQPVISLSFQKSIVPHVHYFTDFQFRCRDVTLNLEELLLLKLYEFFGYPSQGHLERAIGRSLNQAVSSMVSKASFVYVVLLEVVLRHVNLSVYTSGHLPAELSRLKERVGLSLISFENAKVHLQSFTKENSLEDLSSLWRSITDHYKKELHRQAAKILGSVDFLGNPLGFMNDVSDGLMDLAGGNVGGLVTNLTHGISNSTAKFTSSLSKSLEVATVDVRHQEMRRRIHQDGRDHFRAGIRGLGVGIMGGVTSIVTQTYDGVAKDGFEGLFSGFGKGLLGTVTKPTVGMLDFATGAASALRESMRKISHTAYNTRKRPPRVCVGPRGLLPPYDENQALGQQYFYTSSNIRDRDDTETFDSFHTISSECVCFISSERLRFLSWNPASKKHGKVILSLSFNDVVKCTTEKRNVSRDLTVACIVIVAYEDDFSSDDFTSSDFPSFGPSENLSSRTRRRVRTTNTLQCSSDRLALRVCQVVNLAKSDFDKKRSLTAHRRL